MALPAVGSQITMSQIAGEFGGSAPHALSEYYGDGNAPASGEIQMSADFGGTSAVQTFIVTTEGSYYGYIGVDVNRPFGALNTGTYVDNAGNTRNIWRMMYGHTSQGLFLQLSGTASGSNAFSKLSINCGGTYYDFTRTRASETVSSNNVQWNWSLSVLTSAEETALNGQLDGSGTTTFQIHK